MAVISVTDLAKRYGGATEPAVKGVSFTVAHGEFMVLLGPSGCGKSTVLRMIAGLEPISSGTVAIDGRVVNSVPAKDRDIAMVFQSYALYPHMSVYDNLAFGLRRRGVPKAKIDARVDAVAQKLGLAALTRRKPHALSGGQRQRVALGRAIVRDPKVFLFDEPLSNLDAALRVSTRNELIRQQRELGTTTVYVTHDQVEAMTMGHRICIMDQGLVVQIGRPLDVYREPANAFVARFLGSPPMNLLAADLRPLADGVEVSVSGAVFALPAALAPAIAKRPAGPVTLGIRPEDLYEAPPPDVAPTVVRLPVRVVAVEPLGAETILLLELGDGRAEFLARIVRSSGLSPGDRAEIALDARALHFFDHAVGTAIGRAAA